MSENELSIGWHNNVSFGDYVRLDAASASGLEAVRDCPARAKQARDSTLAQRIGQVVHAAILEPYRFKADYVVEPDLSTILTDKGEPYASPRSSKKYKEAVKKLSNDGKRVVLTGPEHEMAIAIQKAVRENRNARKFLHGKGTATEVTGIFRDPVTGVPCKIRPDARAELIVGEHIVNVSVKTARSAGPDDFRRDMYKYGYHRAEAFYQMGYEQIDGQKPADSVFLVIEKEPPYLMALYRIDVGSLDAGEQQMRLALDLFARCHKAGHWPGYPATVEDINLPHYAWKEVDDEIGTDGQMRGAA